jgi:hypothetical protein
VAGRAVGLLAPAVLAALVVTRSVAGDRGRRRPALRASPWAPSRSPSAPLLVVIAAAATTAALIRLFGLSPAAAVQSARVGTDA